MIPTEMPSGLNVQDSTIAFKQVNITGKVMCFSGGPNGQIQNQALSIYRTPDGTLYLDDKGTVCTQFSPEMGIIKAKNALGYGMMLKILGQATPVTGQPSVGFALPGSFNHSMADSSKPGDGSGLQDALPPPPSYASVEADSWRDKY